MLSMLRHNSETSTKARYSISWWIRDPGGRTSVKSLRGVSAL